MKLGLAALVAACWLMVPKATRAATEGPPELAEPPTRPSRDTPAGASRKADEANESLRLGVLGGIGFPRPLSLEAMIKIKRTVGLGVEYSLMPQVGIGATTVSFSALAADARFFPFQGAFFVGLRAGHQTMQAETTVTVAPYGSFTESATAAATFVNPRLGFLFTTAEGFTIGIDAGVQVPLEASYASTLPKNLPVAVDAGMEKVARTFGNSVTPTVDLLKVGLLF